MRGYFLISSLANAIRVCCFSIRLKDAALLDFDGKKGGGGGCDEMKRGSLYIQNTGRSTEAKM